MDKLPVRRIEMPTPYAVGPVNAYLIDAEPLTLIDAGVNTPQAQNALRIALAAAAVFPESIERILITHAHPDHYGLVHVLQEASGATVHFPEREIARVRDRQLVFEVGRLLVAAGMPLDLLFKMDQQRKEGPHPAMSHDEVLPVKDRDRFEFHTDGTAFELEARLMPGHTGAMSWTTTATRARSSPATSCCRIRRPTRFWSRRWTCRGSGGGPSRNTWSHSRR